MVNPAVFMLNELRSLDEFSHRDSFLHSIDARAKLIVTLFFVVSVMFVDKYEISKLIPFFIYPIVIISISGLSYTSLLRKMILVFPGVFLIGILNVFFDTDKVLLLGQIEISKGWILFLSIVIRFSITVASSILLVFITDIQKIGIGLRQLGMPNIFVVQIIFLYRYIFVLMDEAVKMIRARRLRNYSNKALNIKEFWEFSAEFLIRTVRRSKAIYRSMELRGFNGSVLLINKTKFNYNDLLYIILWASYFLFITIFNIPLMFGILITGE